MVAMNLNSPSYALAATTSSTSVTLTQSDANQTSLVIYNSGTSAVFLVSGYAPAPTAVIPTSAPLNGKMIAPGATVTFSKNAGDLYLSGISASGTNTLYISLGSGE
jgi:hypothetical protein